MKKVGGKDKNSWYKWAFFWTAVGFGLGLWYAEHKSETHNALQNLETKVCQLQELIC